MVAFVNTRDRVNQAFNRFAMAVSKWAGSMTAFMLAVLSVLVWAAAGPFFHYSDSWNLYINTGTTIVTFLMVFLIQASQNRDGIAIQTKLDELIRSSAARDRFIGIDQLGEDEVRKMRDEEKTDSWSGRSGQ